MSIPGHDARKLWSPDDEYNGPECDWCGNWRDIRVQSEGRGRIKPTLTCEDCFTGTDDGPCFDDLQPAEDYAGEQAAERADYFYEQQRERAGEGAA